MPAAPARFGGRGFAADADATADAADADAATDAAAAARIAAQK